MAHTFKLAARMARHRAPLFAALILAFSGCDTTESLSPDSTTLPEVGVETAAVSEPSFAAVSFAGGIPIGHFGQPASAFGHIHNGSKIAVSPSSVMPYLKAVRARGGKVALMLAGNDRYYKDSRGFNFTKWKARVDRFKNLNFTSYINDGTIIGHFMVDEPNDSHNWYGKTISPAMVDEMARYSKSRWPKMATLARAPASYFKSRNPRYLDAAWAQYTVRKGTASDFIRRNVADAQRAGLALVVGLNIKKGGANLRRMTPTQVKSFGLTVLSSSYPCAFLSWEYESYLSTGSMSAALRTLRAKAQSRSTRTCRS